ncbi:MAG: hypothetical protein JJU42_07700 [Rhodobacteraceae bacterium]|nr:hypothetical protein [Paracoccaceae bacterium]
MPLATPLPRITLLASIAAMALLATGCTESAVSAPRAAAPPVGVETRRGHARVQLADGRRCQAPFPPQGAGSITGRLEACGQPWAYVMEPAPRTGSETLADIIIGINMAVGRPFSTPEPRRLWVLSIRSPEGPRWRWRVWQGREARGTPGERL